AELGDELMHGAGPDVVEFLKAAGGEHAANATDDLACILLGATLHCFANEETLPIRKVFCQRPGPLIGEWIAEAMASLLVVLEQLAEHLLGDGLVLRQGDANLSALAVHVPGVPLRRLSLLLGFLVDVAGSVEPCHQC